MQDRDREVEHLSGLLKRGTQLTEEHVCIIKSKLTNKLDKVGVPVCLAVPFRLLRPESFTAILDVVACSSHFPQLARKSSDMRPFMDAWDKRMSDVDVFVQQHEGDTYSSSSSSSSEEEDDEETPESRVRDVGNPSSPSDGSKYAKCGILHLESCNVIVKEGDGALVCKDCPEDIDSGDDGARATKRRRKAEKVTLPEGESTVEVDTSIRVVVSDVFGHSLGYIPHARHVIQLENLPAGAPNGGSRTFFPPTASQYFIARFTNAGDTVLGVGVESTTVAEDAISRGRRVEFYVTDESKRASLQAKISSSFHKAHSSGMFQSRRGGKEVVVGPNCLPAGLPPSNVPERVSVAAHSTLKAALEKEPDVLTASYTVAQTIAKTTHLTLQGDHHSPKLVMKKPRRASKAPKEVSDIPVWGELIVYPSPQAAKDSLTQEEVDEEYVRLLRIATNAQLQLMLEPGTERCTPEAALYLRVAATCPVFWVRSESKTKADLDISCDIPQRGLRANILETVSSSGDGSSGSAVRVCHVRNKPSATSNYKEEALFVSTECRRIVGSLMFDSVVAGVQDGEDEDEEE
ncbi:unnamed protein product [Ectocarpus sp. CCAP 1310/34]|nr:unnamed protein product [Ectocarpus sp. CCAP 1310/34]